MGEGVHRQSHKCWMQTGWEKLRKDIRLKIQILYKLLKTYGLFVLNRHLATLYIGTFIFMDLFTYGIFFIFALNEFLKLIRSMHFIGGYAHGPEFGERIRSELRSVCSELTPQVIAIIDAVAPPDQILSSSLGMSDGRHVFMQVWN